MLYVVPWTFSDIPFRYAVPRVEMQPVVQRSRPGLSAWAVYGVVGNIGFLGLGNLKLLLRHSKSIAAGPGWRSRHRSAQGACLQLGARRRSTG